MIRMLLLTALLRPDEHRGPRPLALARVVGRRLHPRRDAAVGVRERDHGFCGMRGGPLAPARPRAEVVLPRELAVDILPVPLVLRNVERTYRKRRFFYGQYRAKGERKG